MYTWTTSILLVGLLVCGVRVGLKDDGSVLQDGFSRLTFSTSKEPYTRTF
jgi:hypothetical protein